MPRAPPPGIRSQLVALLLMAAAAAAGLSVAVATRTPPSPLEDGGSSSSSLLVLGAAGGDLSPSAAACPPPGPLCPPPCPANSTVKSTQCLYYLQETHKEEVCGPETGPERRREALHGLRMRHCCEHAADRALPEDAFHGDAQTCRRHIHELLAIDQLASRISCQHGDVLSRYDCGQTYSIAHRCSQCKSFNIRDGVIDYGRDYEFLVAAYYALKFALDDSIVDFRLSTNNNDLGDFDDVVIELELANNIKRLYALQLKHHINSKSISFASMSGNSGNFSLKRYSNEFLKIKANSDPNKFDDFRFVLYTNSFLPPLVQRCGKDEVQVDEMLMPNSQITVTKSKDYDMSLFDTSNGENSMYQFRGGDIDAEFLDKFALFANQMHARDVEKTIRELLMDLCGDINVFTNLLVYFKYWCRGDYGCYKLSKYDVRVKLAELILNPYILNLSPLDVKKNEKAKLFEDAVKCFDVTVIENLNVSVVSDVVSDSDLLKKFGLLPDLLKSWYLNLVPLAVRYNETVGKAMEFCKYERKRKKFLLSCCGHLSTDWKVFNNLSDVSKDLYDRIAECFQIRVQDRQVVSIKDLLVLNCSLNITATELLRLVDGPLRVGELKCKLPKYYVSRNVPKVMLDKNVVHCNGLFVIDGMDILKAREVIKDVAFVHIDDYFILRDVKSSNMNQWNLPKKLIVFCNERAKFEQLLLVSSEISVIHYLRFNDVNCLEWLWSKGGVNELAPFRKHDHDHLVSENEIFDHFTNDLNILCADPGMGKSVMLDFLEANAPDGHWSLKIDLNEHFEFFRTSADLDLFTYFLEVKNDFDKKIAESFAKAGRVLVLWDGFDELPGEAARAAIEAIGKFQKHGFKQVIAGRYFHSETLEQAFGTFALTLTQFSEAEQKDYAYRKLKDECDAETFEMVLEKMYENITMLSGFDGGVPLQTYMLTEIFCGNLEEFSHKQLVTTTDIYRNFIEGKFNYFYDRVRAEHNYSMLQLRENYKKMRVKLYEIAALRVCLDWLDFSKLKLDCTELLDDIKHGRDNLGLIVKVNEEGMAVFAHKTYAEFFSASWFSRNVEHASMLFKEKLRTVRLMFDIILARNSLAHLAVLYKNPQLLRECDDVTGEDVGGRNPLHIAASWGVPCKLIKSENFIGITASPKEDPKHLEILNCLLKHNDPFTVDSIHKCDSIGYADKSLSLSSLEVISQKFNFSLDKLKNFNEFTICYHCIQLKYESLFKRIETVPYVVFMGKRNLLFTAVEHNALSFVPKLLNIYDVNSADIILRTPLFLAAEKGYHEMVLLLLENKAKVTSVTYPPLCGAIRNARICEELIRRGADVNECDGQRFSPLMKAVLSTSPEEVVYLLLQNQADVNYAKEGDTVLHYAAELSLTSQVAEILIAHGADANKKNSKGNTPLLVALENNNFAVAKSLIGHSDLDVHNDKGFCALCLSMKLPMKENNEDLVKILLENGAKTNCTEDEIPALHLAVFNDMTRSVENLLKAGAKVNGLSHGLTALWLVKSVDVLELLVSHGINVNFRNNEGRPALHYVCSTGNLDVVKTMIQYMLQANISSDHCDRHEAVLLANAACHSLECLQLLLDNGIDINAHDSNGLTAVHFAALRGEGLDNLQRASSALNPNMLTEDGYSPLYVAVLSGSSAVVRQLINMGVKVNGLKQNPLHLSCTNGDVVLVLILLRAGSNANAFSNGTTPIFCTGLDPIDYNSPVVSEEIRNRIDQRQLAQMHLDCNKEDCLKELITFGGNVNARMDTSKSTALHLFAGKKLVNMMKILLDAGAEVDVKNCNGQTPLHMSCIVGCEASVKLLLQYNSKADIIDDFGKTPLAWASEKNHVAIMTLLLSSVNYHQANWETFTSPLLASCLASLEAVQLLLENDANVNMPSNVEKPICYDPNKFPIDERIIEYTVNLPCTEIRAANKRWSKPLYEITPLSLATVLGNNELVKLLLKFGANPNHVEANGQSSFSFAYPLIVDIEDFSDCHDIVKELLKYGALPNGLINQYSLLVLAFTSRNKNLFKFLINHGADLDQLCTVVEYGISMTALHFTCYFRDAYDFSQQLIKAGASINASDSQGHTSLHLAAGADNVDVLPLLTQSHIDAEDANGNTALMLASSINIIEFLIAAGHDVNIANKFGHAPIHLWAENGNAEIVQILLDAETHVNYKSNTGDTPLAIATVEGHIGIVELLCQHGADPEIADCFGDTPLHHASELGRVDIVKILSEKLTKEPKNNFGYSPLHKAAVGGHVEVCQMLLDLFEKVEIDARAQNGVTPLKLAACEDHLDVVKWLVSEGAEVDCADNHGNTSLYGAAARNHVAVVMFLHQNGARIHVVDDDGDTPLHDAAANGMLDSVKYLIENGADLTFTNLEGKTPLDLAIEKGQNEIVELIGARVLPLE